MTSLKLDKRYLLVVTVLQGRSFPIRSNDFVRVDVKFDGQALSSPPVPLTEDPVFETDMAFRLTGKQLKDHKIHKTPLKIEVYHVNKRTKKQDKIGYQILDLRTHAMEVGKPRFTWFDLLGTQTFRAKPEVHLGVSVDDDIEAENVERNEPEFTRTSRMKEFVKTLQPTLIKNPQGAYYQLGPSKDSTDIFVFTITVGYASNLDKFFRHLSPSNRPKEFFFHYLLFSNAISTKSFDDFQSNDFSPEKVSCKVKTSVRHLKEYFERVRNLEIQFCQGEGNVIAGATVPFSEILPPSMDDLSRPILLEREFPLIAYPENRFDVPEHLEVSPDETPVVGLSIELKTSEPIDGPDFAQTVNLDSFRPVLSELNSQQDSRPRSAVPESSTSVKPSSVRSKSYTRQDARKRLENYHPNNQGGDNAFSPAEENTDSWNPKKKSSQQNVRQDDRHSPEPIRKSRRTYESEEEEAEDSPEFVPSSRAPRRTEPAPNEKRRRFEEERKMRSSDTQVSPMRGRKVDREINTQLEVKSSAVQTFDDYDTRLRNASSDPTQKITKKFHCSIWLSNIKLVSPNIRSPIPIFLRYQYPFFGSSEPIITKPPMEISPRRDTTLTSNSLTRFTFGCQEEQLIDAFKMSPLCIEVWRYGGSMQNDEIIGSGRLRLDFLWRQEPQRMYEQNKAYVRRVYEGVLEIVDMRSDMFSILAELKVCVTLDDHGPIQYQVVDSLPRPQQSYQPPQSQPVNGYSIQNEVISDPKAKVISLERQAVLELERWKAQEEARFMSQLERKKDQVLKDLRDQFELDKRQQKDNLLSDIQKTRSLEEQLRKLTLETEQQKVALDDRERKIADAERFLRLEKTKLTQEIKEMDRKYSDELKSRVELERASIAVLKAQIDQLKNETEDYRRNVMEKDQEIQRLREEGGPRSFQQREMQAEIDRLNLDKLDLQRKLDDMTSAKDRYKSEWANLSKEVAQVKDQLEKEKERRLEEKERELEKRQQEIERYGHIYNGRDAVTKAKAKFGDGDTKEKGNRNRLAIQFHHQPASSSHWSTNGMIREESDEDQSDERNDSEESEPEVSGRGEANDPVKKLATLMDERNILLRTKLYAPDDPAMDELNKKIKHLEMVTGHGRKRN